MPVPIDDVAQVWAEVIGVPQVDRNTNFFDLGGHSLLLAELVERLNERLAIDTDILFVMEHPTVAGFAASCEQASTTTDP